MVNQLFLALINLFSECKKATFNVFELLQWLRGTRFLEYSMWRQTGMVCLSTCVVRPLKLSKVKYADIAVYSLTYHTATGTHMPYRITQCVTCHPTEVTFPPLPQPKLVLRGMHSWVDVVGLLHTETVYPPKTVTHPSTNRARCALTSFMRRTLLSTTPRRQDGKK